MIVDQAPDSSGNSYGQYSIDRLAYSGSSFSGKKLENSYPNLYINTTAHDISYGFTDDHITDVYDLSYKYMHIIYIYTYTIIYIYILFEVCY